MQSTSPLRFQGACLSRPRGTNPTSSPGTDRETNASAIPSFEPDQFLRRLPQELRGQVRLYRTSRQEVVDEILAQPNKLTQHALSQILVDHYPDRDGENNRLLRQSLQRPCKPLFDALLPKTENLNLPELLEYAALRGMGGPVRALLNKARETRMPIPDETFQHMAECGLPAQLSEGFTVSRLDEGRKTALLQLALNQRTRIQELRPLDQLALGRQLLDLLDLELESPALSNEAVMALIRAGADVNYNDERGIAPLIVAAIENGHDGVVARLMQDDDVLHGTTPLTRAAFRGHRAVVEHLIRAGADVNQDAWFNITPLQMASENGHAAIVNILLQNGADVNQMVQNGITPLLLASETGHAEIVNILLEAGADVNQATQSGVTPLQMAVLNGHEDIAQLLRARGATE